MKVKIQNTPFGGIQIKALALILCAIAMVAMDTVSYAGSVVVVDSFLSPLPHPRFGLDFDKSTGTLWGIENLNRTPNIMNFNLSGSLIQGFTGVGDFNSTGIAVDLNGQHIYYWQNLGRNLHQSRYPDGAFLGTTQFPFGYQNAVLFIDYDPVLNRIVMAKQKVLSPSQGIDIRPGFDFVIPGSGVDFSVELDILRVGDLSLIRGFELTEDSYWLLGPNSALTHDQIVQIDRATGRLVDRFILPNSTGQTYTGLALDPSTSLFYANFSDEGIRALKLTREAQQQEVVIDVRPRSEANKLNPNSRGNINVAILSVNGFDPTTVDPNTVRFGATGTEAAPIHVTRRDVDGDRHRDLVLRFQIQDTGIECSDSSATLTGQISGGVSIIGSQPIRTVQCKTHPVGYVFTTVEIPAIPDGTRIRLSDINDKEEIAATSFGGGLDVKGLLINKKLKISAFTCDETETQANAINRHGTIAGCCFRAGVGDVGFVRDRKGNLTLLEFPGADNTLAFGINDKDEVVGWYIAPVEPNRSGFFRLHGFMWEKGQFSTLDVPLPFSVTLPQGINNKGQIVGWDFTFDPDTNETSTAQGFFYDNGNFTPLNFPGFDSTQLLDINNDGQILGQFGCCPDFATSFGANVAFLFDDGKFFTIGLPQPSGPNATVGNLLVAGINDRGQIVGEYTEISGSFPNQKFTTHAFVATPE